MMLNLRTLESKKLILLQIYFADNDVIVAFLSACVNTANCITLRINGAYWDLL